MCDQCEALTISGVACHETGCPDRWLHPATGQPMPRECKDCGCDFVPETRDQSFCDDRCAAIFAGLEDPYDDEPDWTSQDCPVCQHTLGGTIQPDGVCDGCGHVQFDPADAC